ncbi:hypothetical protein K1719_026285 [Acacia pycnantha]|nr:hypothetical protein K1719_026285 [Acacia pycnantha]
MRTETRGKPAPEKKVIALCPCSELKLAAPDSSMSDLHFWGGCGARGGSLAARMPPTRQEPETILGHNDIGGKRVVGLVWIQMTAH